MVTPTPSTARTPISPEEPLYVRTTPIALPDPPALLRLLKYASTGPLHTWIHPGRAMVGWGEAVKIAAVGAGRFTEAAGRWQQVTERFVLDEASLALGVRPLAFGSFSFSNSATRESTLTVPQVLVRFDGSRSTLTTIGPESAGPTPADLAAEVAKGAKSAEVTKTAKTAKTAESALEPGLPAAEQKVSIEEGHFTRTGWADAVNGITEAIRRGRVDKVVLARDVVARAERIDIAQLLVNLQAAYPTCYTFAVDDLVGASPELLIQRERDRVASRVLAGTATSSADPAIDAERARELFASAKNRIEHDYALASLAEPLAHVCSQLHLPEEPSLLHLHNVMHLASEVSGRLDGSHRDLSSVELAGLVHPTAAVGGTPTQAALELIAELEGIDRGGYASPIGWIDSAGDGEWALALRSAQIEDDGKALRLFAGCGIVEASEPGKEWAESQAKFAPIRFALAPQGQ